MDIEFEKTKTAILAYCIEDWTPIYFVSSFVEQFYRYEDSELIKATSLAIIKNLLDEELVIAGYLLPGNTFKPWDMNIDDILTKIKLKWDSLERKLIPHEIVWFDITEKGRKEFEYLNNLPELNINNKNYYIRILEGGQKAAEELLDKATKGAKLIRSDNLKKLKVYKLLDNTYISYRAHSKFGTANIDIQFSEIKKNIQFKFIE